MSLEHPEDPACNPAPEKVVDRTLSDKGRGIRGILPDHMTNALINASINRQLEISCMLHELFIMTLIIVELTLPTNTRTEFPTLSGSGGFSGVPTVAGPGNCTPTFSVLSASGTVFARMEMDTITSTLTNTCRGAATRSRGVGNSQIPAGAASISVAGPESGGLGTMTN